MSLHSTEMGDHLEIIIFPSILLILLKSHWWSDRIIQTPEYLHESTSASVNRKFLPPAFAVEVMF